MSAAHHGHIICLYAGRAVYCPKMATLQATLKAALDCLGLENGREVHFAFPHTDLAILVEISTLAFKNVRDGAILYLCDGLRGPVYPHELALQAHQGQAQAQGQGGHRPARAITPAAAEGVDIDIPAATGPARDNRTTNTRATRASRRLQRQANETEQVANVNNTADKDISRDPSSARPINENIASAGPSSQRDSVSSSTAPRVKREAMEDGNEDEEEDAYEARARNDAGMPSDLYFKRRRTAL